MKSCSKAVRMSGLVTVVSNFCLHDAKWRIHFCWMSTLLTFTLHWQIHGCVSHCFEMTNPQCSDGLEMWNMFHIISWAHRKLTISCIHGVLTDRTSQCLLVRSSTANFKALLKAVSWFLAFVPPKCDLFLHKLKHFPDVRRYKMFCCFLKWPDCCPLFISPDTATSVHGKSGAQAWRFSLKDSVTVELQHFGASVTI